MEDGLTLDRVPDPEITEVVTLAPKTKDDLDRGHGPGRRDAPAPPAKIGGGRGGQIEGTAVTGMTVVGRSQTRSAPRTGGAAGLGHAPRLVPRRGKREDDDALRPPRRLQEVKSEQAPINQRTNYDQGLGPGRRREGKQRFPRKTHIQGIEASRRSLHLPPRCLQLHSLPEIRGNSRGSHPSSQRHSEM